MEDSRVAHGAGVTHWSRAHCSGVASSGEAVYSVTGGPVAIGSQAAKASESEFEHSAVNFVEVLWAYVQSSARSHRSSSF